MFKNIPKNATIKAPKKKKKSYPVGSVQYIDMFSLNFREFLRSSGVGDEIIEELMEHFLNRTSVPWAIHDKIMELFRLYIILGGMPEALSIYYNNNSIADADGADYNCRDLALPNHGNLWLKGDVDGII